MRKSSASLKNDALEEFVEQPDHTAAGLHYIVGKVGEKLTNFFSIQNQLDLPELVPVI